MEIAIARVKHIAHLEVVVSANLADAAQHMGEPRSWHNAILYIKFGADSSYRAKSILASSPEQLALRLVGCDAHHPRMMFVADAHYLFNLFFYRLAHALRLDQQYGSRIHGVARVSISLHRLQNHLVHHLNSGGNDAVGDNLGDSI